MEALQLVSAEEQRDYLGFPLLTPGTAGMRERYENHPCYKLKRELLCEPHRFPYHRKKLSSDTLANRLPVLCLPEATETVHPFQFQLEWLHLLHGQCKPSAFSSSGHYIKSVTDADDNTRVSKAGLFL